MADEPDPLPDADPPLDEGEGDDEEDGGFELCAPGAGVLTGRPADGDDVWLAAWLPPAVAPLP